MRAKHRRTGGWTRRLPGTRNRARSDRSSGVALLLTVLAVAACGPVEGGEVDEGPWAGEELEEPLERPSFTLTDTRGEPFDFRAETEGYVTLLFFGYTHCPDVCPVHMANLGAVMRDLSLEVKRHIRVVFVTTDPERDTAERLEEWLARMHPSFIGLRGSREEVNAVEESLGLPSSIVEKQAESDEIFVGHAAQVIAFDAHGPARVVYPWGTRQRDWLRDLPKLVRETVPEWEDESTASGGR